jgi:hypothetical protein
LRLLRPVMAFRQSTEDERSFRHSASHHLFKPPT